MSINIGPASSDDLRPKIMVIGVGGAGGNAIANMMRAEIEGVDFIVANTDAQALSNSSAEKRIQLGPDITGGLGAGARPEVGKAAAEETVDEIEHALEGVNMCFIAAGMGGGTGTGAAPVIAEAARRKGVLTVGVVTKPFLFEGTRRMRAAEAGIDELQQHVDTLIVIPNQNLFLVAKADTTFKEAFALADEVLQQGVRSITDLMVMPGLINLDFADVRSVMQEMGKAMMGTGESEGENRALEAAERAIANPLLDGVSMAGAKGVIISIIGGEDMKLLEVDEAANHIRELVDEDANIIWGSAFNPELDGKIRVSVVATGIDHSGAPAQQPTRAFTLSDAKPPKRPTIDLPREDEAELEPFELSEGLAADPEPEPEEEPAAAVETPYRDDAEPMELTAAEYADPESEHEPESETEAEPEPAHSTSESRGEDDDEFEDVDEIVDPLAGLRNEHTERFERGEDDMPPPADDSGHAEVGESGGFGNREDEWDFDGQGGERPPLDLSDPAYSGDNESGDANTGGAPRDELELGADQYADATDSPLQSKPRKRPALPGAGAGAGAQGSTLFERMANLSRGANASTSEEDSDDDDEDEGGAALNIPRFLGRQNNQ